MAYFLLKKYTFHGLFFHLLPWLDILNYLDIQGTAIFGSSERTIWAHIARRISAGNSSKINFQMNYLLLISFDTIPENVP
jgi:hypothetical protein